MGITGEDIIRESQADVVVLHKLGLGKCRLAVQAPIGQFKDASELAGKRIVTSFPNVSREYFAKFPKHGEDTDIK
jgi:ATP phosphoribosyltransferase